MAAAEPDGSRLCEAPPLLGRRSCVAPVPLRLAPVELDRLHRSQVSHPPEAQEPLKTRTLLQELVSTTRLRAGVKFLQSLFSPLDGTQLSIIVFLVKN